MRTLARWRHIFLIWRTWQKIKKTMPRKPYINRVTEFDSSCDCLVWLGRLPADWKERYGFRKATKRATLEPKGGVV